MTTWVRRFALALLALGLVMASGATTVVTADQGPQGIDGLGGPPPNIQQGNQPLLVEAIPATAYSLPTGINAGGTQFGPVTIPDPRNAVADAAFTIQADAYLGILIAGSRAVIVLMEWSYQIDLIKTAGPTVENMINALRVFYGAVLGLVLVTWAGWVLWHWTRHRPVTAWQGVGWGILVASATAVFFATPGGIIGGVDGFTNQMSLAMLGVTGQADPAIANRANDPTLARGDVATAEMRVDANRLWTTMVFLPYCDAALGDTRPTTLKLCGELLAKQAGQSSNFDHDISQAPKSTQDWYAGSFAPERPPVLELAIGAAVFNWALIALEDGVMLLSQAAFLLLVMMAPIPFAIGIHPGIGRAWLGRWFEWVVAALAIRILASLLLDVTLTAMSIAGSAGNWEVTSVIDSSLLVVAVIFHKRLFRLFDGAFHPRREVSRHWQTESAWRQTAEWVGNMVNRNAQPAPSFSTATGQGAAATAAAPRTTP